MALHLANALRERIDVRVFITSSTSQGVDLLHRGREKVPIDVGYFPFDLPRLMWRALSTVRPRVVVVLETELWPGLFSSCRRLSIPLIMANARLSPGSLKGHLFLKKFWQRNRPQKVLAVSGDDAIRYRQLFGDGIVGIMGNMKFDRVTLGQPASHPSTIRGLIPDSIPFVVLGSIRKEEERDILHVMASLRENRRDMVIGLFPRHMHRVKAWEKRLSKEGIPYVLRSRAEGKRPASGSVVLWDVMGELSQAYGLAKAVFVGGSLKPCGGQNFLEPLVHGVIPNVGPHWKNFQWIGREIFRQGLARQVRDKEELASALLRDLASQRDREEVLKMAKDYLDKRRGGTEMVCREIIKRISPR